jgi:hypothetical protein
MSDDHVRSWLRLVRYAVSGLLLGGALGFLGALVLPRPQPRGERASRAPVPRQVGPGDGVRRPGAGQDVVLVADDAAVADAPAARLDPVVERR